MEFDRRAKGAEQVYNSTATLILEIILIITMNA